LFVLSIDLVSGDQLTPASLVLIMSVPAELEPAAYPVFESVKQTDSSEFP